MALRDGWMDSSPGLKLNRGKRAVVGELGSESPQFIEEAVGTSLEWGEP